MEEKKEELRYIVFDLEWNQSAEGKAGEVPELPFEIIEIGAVRLKENLEEEGEWSGMVRPAVYHRLHFKVMEIMQVGIEELKKKGEPFPEVFRAFLDWCTEPRDGTPVRPIFCTWGSMDLYELQQNMVYYGISTSCFPYPLLYYDVQKLYHRIEPVRSKDRPPLDKAVDALGIRRDRPFHRALDDARYTSRILQTLGMDVLKPYVSVDYYRLPASPEEEMYLVFPDYSKYVSRSFQDREAAMADKTVTDMLCFRCGRLLPKKIRWFTSNQRYYYCLSWCPEHGALRGKIRLKPLAEDRVFVIKTIKCVDEETVARMMAKKAQVLGKRRLRRHHGK